MWSNRIFVLDVIAGVYQASGISRSTRSLLFVATGIIFEEKKNIFIMTGQRLDGQNICGLKKHTHIPVPNLKECRTMSDLWISSV